MRVKWYIVTFQILAILLAIGTSFSQGYPQKPIRFIIPYPPGGGTSMLARIFAEKLTVSMGQTWVQDFRPGANGSLASELAAKAVPDGYTLLLGTISTMTINPSLYKKLKYDPIKNFAPISTFARLQNILIVHPSVPAKSIPELIALAKSRPGKLTFGSSGNGSTLHLSGELFKSMTGVSMNHIPYKGGGPAMIDLLGGRISMIFCNMIDAMPQVRAGKLNALGVTGKSRSPIAPDIPTIAEAGLPGFEVSAWFGVFAPTGTPKEIVTKLNTEIANVTHMPDLKELLLKSGTEAISCSTEEFSALIKADLVKWAKVVKESGAKID